MSALTVVGANKLYKSEISPEEVLALSLLDEKIAQFTRTMVAKFHLDSNL